LKLTDERRKAMWAKKGNPKSNWNDKNRFQGSWKNVYKLSSKNANKLSSMDLGKRRIDSVYNHQLPTHQALSMSWNDFHSHVIDTAKNTKWETEANKAISSWSVKSSVEDLDDPKEGNVLFDFVPEGAEYEEDEPKRNAVPLGSYDGFFSSMWNQSENDIVNDDEVTIKREILEEKLEKLVDKEAPKDYLLLQDGDYYLVRDGGN
jgi:hypothetical protein